MQRILSIFLVTACCNVLAEIKTHSVHIDVKELRCLVCKASLAELDLEVQKIDPTRKIEVGGYRLDAQGNIKQKTVSEAKSEIRLSELADTICDKMDDYIRATWKDTGKLTILRLIDSNGQMNSDMGLVDVIQDDDLNKSLKYYCEGIMEEYEDNIIEHYKSDSENVTEKVCVEETELCPAQELGPELESRSRNEL